MSFLSVINHDDDEAAVEAARFNLSLGLTSERKASRMLFVSIADVSE